MTRHRLLSRYDSGVLRLAVMFPTICLSQIYDCDAQEGELVTLLEADRVPAGLPPPPAYQVFPLCFSVKNVLNR